MSDFGKVNQIYSQYFVNHHPARICVAAYELPKNAKVEIDAIVAYPESKLWLFVRLFNDLDKSWIVVVLWGFILVAFPDPIALNKQI